MEQGRALYLSITGPPEKVSVDKMTAEGNHKEGEHTHQAGFALMDEVDRQCWRGPGLCSLEAAGYDITLTYTQCKDKNLWAQLQVGGFALYISKRLLGRTWFSSVISGLTSL